MSCISVDKKNELLYSASGANGLNYSYSGINELGYSTTKKCGGTEIIVQGYGFLLQSGSKFLLQNGNNLNIQF
jgi:hypothetical protein